MVRTNTLMNQKAAAAEDQPQWQMNILFLLDCRDSLLLFFANHFKIS